MGFSLLSCEHRPLEDPANAHYLRVYLDENLRNVTFGFYNPQYERPHYSSPRVMRAVLADPHTGRVVAERYLQNQGTDEKGYYIEGYINAPPGTYNLLVYSYGAPYTMVRNENDYYTMQAYTNRASDYYHKYMLELMQRIDAGTIRQQPDHMFHEMMENIIIVRNQGVDTLRNANRAVMVGQLPLTKEMCDRLKADTRLCKSIKIAGQNSTFGVYPLNGNMGWSVDNYGPVWIPKRGESVSLTLDNIAVYERPIVAYEGNTLDVRDGKIFINGRECEHYTFKMDYYWMMGDNRHNSADSRCWGFVPEDHIVGRALLVWLSLDKDRGWFDGKIRWGRMFRSVGSFN
jgi:hypothetical protein